MSSPLVESVAAPSQPQQGVPLVGAPPTPLVPPAVAATARKKSFPEALYDLVQYCHGNHKDKLSWADDDDGFVVKDRRYFEFHILPLFFRHGRFGSLERQLANYGFRRDGRGIGAYRHEEGLFRRNQPDNIKNITLRKNKRTRDDANYEETPEPMNVQNPNAGVPRGSSAEGPAAAMMMLAQASAAGPVPAVNQAPGAVVANQAVMASPAALPAPVAAAGNPPPTVSMDSHAIRPVPSPTTPFPTQPIRTPPPPQVTTQTTTAMINRTPVSSGLRFVASEATTAVAPVSVASMSTAMQGTKVMSSDLTQAYDNDPGTTKKMPRLSMAVLSPGIPNLPRHVVQRSDVLNLTVKNLIEHSPTVPREGFASSRNNSHTVFVTGRAGIGRSAAASTIVRSAEVRRFVYDGVSWLSLGTKKIESVTLVECYKMMVRQIRLTDSNCDPPDFAIENQRDHDGQNDKAEERMEAARSAMSTFVASRRSLIVLDDVLHLEDLHWFDFGRSNVPYRVLTTRMNPVGYDGLDMSFHVVTLDEKKDEALHDRASKRSKCNNIQIDPSMKNMASELENNCAERTEVAKRMSKRTESRQLMESFAAVMTAVFVAIQGSGAAHTGRNPTAHWTTLALGNQVNVVPPQSVGALLGQPVAPDSVQNRPLAVIPAEVPDVPAICIERPSLENSIKEMVQSSSPKTVYITGTVGCGKSHLAAKVVRDVDVLQRCANICWINLSGRKIASPERLISYYRCVVPGGDLQIVVDDEADTQAQMEQARASMARYFVEMGSLVHGKSLVVLDGLCHLDDLQWFQFGSNMNERACPCRVVVTTTLDPIVHGGMRPGIIVEANMTEKEAIDLLRVSSGRHEFCDRELREAREIVSWCDFIPLPVKAAGQMARANYRRLDSVISRMRNGTFINEAASQRPEAFDLVGDFDKSFASLGVGDDAERATFILKTFLKRLSLPYATDTERRPWIPFSFAEGVVTGMDPVEANDRILALAPSARQNDTTDILLGALATLGLLEIRRRVTWECRIRHDYWLAIVTKWDVE